MPVDAAGVALTTVAAGAAAGLAVATGVVVTDGPRITVAPRNAVPLEDAMDAAGAPISIRGLL